MRYLIFYGTLLIVCLDVVFALQQPLLIGHGNDFAHYYTTSWLLREGVSPYGISLESSYEQLKLVNLPSVSVATNPPVLAFLFLPFTLFDPAIAFVLWSVFQFVLLFLALKIYVSILGYQLSSSNLLHLFLACFFTYATFSHFRYGQTQFLILFLLVIGIQCIQRDRYIFAGCLWGLATSLKLFTWPLIFILLFRCSLLSAGAFALAFTLPLAAILCWDSAALYHYFHTSIPFITESLAHFNGSNSFIGALCVTGKVMGLRCEGSFDSLNFISAVSLLLLSLITVLYSRRSQGCIIKVTIQVVLLSLLFSPTTWNHYLVLCFLPLTYLYSKGLTLLWAVTYMFLALSQGAALTENVFYQLTSAWFGPFACLLCLFQMIWPKEQAEAVE